MKCPTCQTEVIEATNGLLLNPKKSRFGRYWRDGTTATADTIRAGHLTYFEHVCTTKATPATNNEQPALF